MPEFAPVTSAFCPCRTLRGAAEPPALDPPAGADVLLGMVHSSSSLNESGAEWFLRGLCPSIAALVLLAACATPRSIGPATPRPPEHPTARHGARRCGGALSARQRGDPSASRTVAVSKHLRAASGPTRTSISPDSN